MRQGSMLLGAYEKKCPLSFNRLFAQNYLSLGTFATLDIENTLANEICTIPQFAEIYINKKGCLREGSLKKFKLLTYQS